MLGRNTCLLTINLRGPITSPVTVDDFLFLDQPVVSGLGFGGLVEMLHCSILLLTTIFSLYGRRCEKDRGQEFCFMIGKGEMISK